VENSFLPLFLSFPYFLLVFFFKYATLPVLVRLLPRSSLYLVPTFYPDLGPTGVNRRARRNVPLIFRVHSARSDLLAIVRYKLYISTRCENANRCRCDDLCLRFHSRIIRSVAAIRICRISPCSLTRERLRFLPPLYRIRIDNLRVNNLQVDEDQE